MLWGSLVVPSSRGKHSTNNFPTLEDWTDRLSRNTSKLPTYAVLTTQKTAFALQWKPEIPKLHTVLASCTNKYYWYIQPFKMILFFLMLFNIRIY
jgi:hypothetical protein